MSRPTDFSFRNATSPLTTNQSLSCLTFPKPLMSSDLNLNNTSRFQEKKVLRKVREQELLNRIDSTSKRFADNDQRAKQAFKFKPLHSSNTKDKEN